MRSSFERDAIEEGYQRGETVREGATEMIDSLEFKSFINKRSSTFKIATGSADTEQNVIVKVKCGSEFGVGNANPTNVTHETLASIEDFLAKAKRKIEGTDEDDLLKLHQRLDA